MTRVTRQPTGQWESSAASGFPDGMVRTNTSPGVVERVPHADATTEHELPVACARERQSGDAEATLLVSS